MDREEILEKSRRENRGIDEAETRVLEKAGKLAAQVGMTLCCVISVLEVIFTEKISLSSWTIYFSILGTTFLIKYIRLRKKHELLLAIFYLCLCAAFLTLYLLRLTGKDL